MKIKLINNTFFEITSIKKFKLICDPWLGNMRDTATWSYPNISGDKKILNKLKPNIVYISHLHTDHFDEEIIKNLKNKNTKFIIKKFKDQRLKNKIGNLGIKNVIELEEWKTYSFNSFEITIIPCDIPTHQDLNSEIKYDLDSSILIYEKFSKMCFYNNVDNPCSDKIIKKVKSVAKKKYKKIDIASFAPRPASEFPQCFINLSSKEKLNLKNSVIKTKLNESFKKFKLLEAKNFIPAGGNFIVYGKYNKIQKFVAHPSINQIENFFNLKKISFYNIDNCGYINCKNGKIQKFYKPKNLESNFKLPNSILKKKYKHEDFNRIINTDDLFLKAKKNYLTICKKIGIKKSWKLNIFLYKNLNLDKKYNIKNKKKYLKHYKITLNNNKKPNFFNIFLEIKLFNKLLKGSQNWNMTIGGSLIMFERKPNKFIPDIPFSLNFLKV